MYEALKKALLPKKWGPRIQVDLGVQITKLAPMTEEKKEDGKCHHIFMLC